jgi:glutamine amidotransferase
MTIAIIDTGLGNVGSVANMLRHLGIPATLTRSPDAVLAAERLILAGVGAFDAGMAAIDHSGLRPCLDEAVISRAKPILGICLGMQLLGQGSAEGDAPGLGWMSMRACRFDGAGFQPPLRVPHMGWNFLHPCRSHPLLAGLGPEPRFYFAHSYHVVCDDPADILAETVYGQSFVSMVARANVAGVQFHPEKSHSFGMAVLKAFSAWRPGEPS